MRVTRQRTPAQRLAMALGAFAVLFLSYYLGNQYGRLRLEREISATLVVPPSEISPFTLSSTGGEPFTRKDLEGHWTLLYVGCFRCDAAESDILPIFTRIYNRLADQPQLQEQTRLVLVSEQPDTQVPADLREGLLRFHPEIIGVTGSEEELDTFYAGLDPDAARFAADAPYPESPLYLIGPEAEVLALFTGWVDVGSIADDVKKIAERLGE